MWNNIFLFPEFPDYETIGKFKHENESHLMVNSHCSVPAGLLIPDDV